MGEFATKRAEELSIEDFIHLHTLKNSFWLDLLSSCKFLGSFLQ